MATENENVTYDQEFRKSFRKCIKAILLSENDVNTYLDNIVEQCTKHEVYTSSLQAFEESINEVPEEAKDMFRDIFNQGVSCGVILLISMLINNTGYFADCAFDENEQQTSN